MRNLYIISKDEFRKHQLNADFVEYELYEINIIPLAPCRREG